MPNKMPFSSLCLCSGPIGHYLCNAFACRSMREEEKVRFVCVTITRDHTSGHLSIRSPQPYATHATSNRVQLFSPLEAGSGAISKLGLTLWWWFVWCDFDFVSYVSKLLVPVAYLLTVLALERTGIRWFSGRRCV